MLFFPHCWLAQRKGRMILPIAILSALLVVAVFLSNTRYNPNDQKHSPVSIKTIKQSIRSKVDLNNLNGSIPLYSPRRDHALLMMEDRFIVNIAGRGINNIETFDLYTGQQTVFADQLLDFNHITAVNLHHEIYFVCALSGGEANHEIASEYIHIFEWKKKSLRKGPLMRKGRSACGAVILKQVIVKKSQIIVNTSMDNSLPESWSEDLICVLGGSVGSHNHGRTVSDVDCYSNRGQGWIMLPQLPVPLDHLTAHTMRIPRSRDTSDQQGSKTVSTDVIPTTCSEEQYIVVVGGRTKNIGGDRKEVYQLSLRTGTWDLVTTMHYAKSAFTSVLLENRYVATLGGVSYINKERRNIVFDEIEICDMPKKKCFLSKRKLKRKRYAVMATSTNDFIFFCGGTEFGKENLPDCEVIPVNELLPNRDQT